MEDLRAQFQNTKEQHEKALEDIACERAVEISQLKESHEALMLAMTQERDTVAESLKVGLMACPPFFPLPLPSPQKINSSFGGLHTDYWHV